MCVVAVKYLKDYGWVGAKNRDRNYVVNIDIVRSNRGNVQRLYIDDQTTRWTEGLNEHGLCIISASLSVKADEKEGDKAAGNRKKKAMVSPDGLAIRRALLLSDPKKAAQSLIADELAGATFVFNRDTCYLLEGGYTVKKDASTADNPREYKYVLKEIDKVDNHAVRTNHGIDLTFLGYSKNGKDAITRRNRDSSESRRNVVEKSFNAATVKTPYDVLACMSIKPNDDPFMNPIRTGDPKKNEMVTTGQLLLVPSECTLHYRPIYSGISFDYPGINGAKDNRVFFEIISSRKLLSFQEFTKK